jgi:hypothetical protein
MIEELSILLDEFPGAKNRTRCFTHILNLVAKCILKQFDVPKAKAGVVLDDVAAALQDLAGEIETEEADMAREMSGELEADDDGNDQSLLDARAGMSEEEVTELEESVQPIQLVLVKVIT